MSLPGWKSSIDFFLISVGIKAKVQEIAYQALSSRPLSIPGPQLLFSPHSLALVILACLLFLEHARQVLASEDLNWLFSRPVTHFPCYLHNPLPHQFGFFYSNVSLVRLSFTSQSEITNFPYSTPILPPLVLISPVTIYHPIYFTYFSCFFSAFFL